MKPALSLSDIRETHKALKSFVIETPLIDGKELLPRLGHNIGKLLIKPEFLQRSGSFKFRGAVNVIRSLSSEQLRNGITAFSGGNHAIAVSYVARELGVSAKVVMPSAASPMRVAKCRELGAEVFLVENRADVPVLAQSFVEREGRTLIPPFEHAKTVEATASLGLEFYNQFPEMDVILMAIGGGGLAAGVSTAIKLLSPKCKIIGVQPKTADAMARSLVSGKPELNEHVNTVADSLCPPQVGLLTSSLCRDYLDGILIVEESAIRESMKLIYETLKFVAEGAAAVPLAALLSGVLRPELGSNVGIIVGGSSIDLSTFRSQATL